MLLTELSSSGASRILAAGLARSHSRSIQGRLQNAPGHAHSLADLAQQSDAVLVYEAGCAAAIEESIDALWDDLPQFETAFIALVPRSAPPAIDSKYEEPISSFICSAALFRKFLDLGLDCYPSTLCFALLRAIAKGDLDVDRLLVRQVPLVRRTPGAQDTRARALVLPHRGDPAFLRASLKFLGRTAGCPVKVRVGLDVEDENEYASFPRDYPAVDFFRFGPSPVGPYVIRQALAERSPEPLLTLQDSDDISSFDRFTVLSQALAETGSDIVGSHELCLDEMRTLVQPVRFPLDSNAALDTCANHALLHATLICGREAFFRAGGLATNLIIASDTQFLLRAHFNTRIRNVDEFLYIRRRHATSLTNAPETIYDNPLRRKLSEEWTRDFNAVRSGKLKLEDSTLWPQRRLEPVVIESLNGHRKYRETSAGELTA